MSKNYLHIGLDAEAIRTPVSSAKDEDVKAAITAARRHAFLMQSHMWPARLNATESAWALGFEPYHMTILVQERLITPLGNALPLSERWFATVVIQRLSRDVTFLAKATNAIYEHSRKDNGSRKP